MASPALLFLLLVSSSLLHPVDSTAKVSRVRPKREVVTTALGVVSLLTPFVNVMFKSEKAKIITATLKLATGGLLQLLKKDPNAKLLNEIKDEFKSLSFKMEDYHIDQKWEIRSAVFQAIEKDIENSWDKYQNLLEKHLTNTKETVDSKTLKEFTDYYKDKKDATRDLHRHLTKEGPTFITRLDEAVKEHVRCHEQYIRAYTDLINSLMYKGNVMNLFYDYYTNATDKEKKAQNEVQMAYDAAKALFQLHHSCLIESENCIKKDVERLIENGKDKTELANTIRLFLAENYARYDWMVIVFLTKSSSHKTWLTKWRNNHILDGFTKVERGDITVAVARQVKGTHSNADQVRGAIKRCIPNPEKVTCREIPKKLRKCSEMTDRPYTAVHAFLMKGHQSYDGKEFGVYVSTEKEIIPYFYEGECFREKDVLISMLPDFIQKAAKAKKSGEFVVMIKSDQEWSSGLGGKIKKVDPCSKVDCGGDKGHCVKVKDLFIGLCECHKNRYGKNCEGSVEDYKKKLLETLEPEQGPASRPAPPRRKSV